jgi:large conductance mechanosensitive channel
MIQEFKAFVNQGNAIDLAVGVVIGAAFGKIVNSMVNDIIMPLVGALFGRVDFRQLFVALNGRPYPNIEAALAEKAPVLTYGVFINTVVEFFIVAFSIFLVVRQISRWRRTSPAKA